MTQQLLNVVGSVKGLSAQTVTPGGTVSFSVDIANGPPPGKFWVLLNASLSWTVVAGAPSNWGFGIVNVGQQAITDTPPTDDTVVDWTNRGFILPLGNDDQNSFAGTIGPGNFGYVTAAVPPVVVIANNQTIRAWISNFSLPTGWDAGDEITLNVEVQELPLDPCTPA